MYIASLPPLIVRDNLLDGRSKMMVLIKILSLIEATYASVAQLTWNISEEEHVKRKMCVEELKWFALQTVFLRRDSWLER